MRARNERTAGGGAGIDGSARAAREGGRDGGRRGRVEDGGLASSSSFEGTSAIANARRPGRTRGARASEAGGRAAGRGPTKARRRAPLKSSDIFLKSGKDALVRAKTSLPAGGLGRAMDGASGSGAGRKVRDANACPHALLLARDDSPRVPSSRARADALRSTPSSPAPPHSSLRSARTRTPRPSATPTPDPPPPAAAACACFRSGASRSSWSGARPARSSTRSWRDS